MKQSKIFALLAAALLLTGCGGKGSSSSASDSSQESSTSVSQSSEQTSESEQTSSSQESEQSSEESSSSSQGESSSSQSESSSSQSDSSSSSSSSGSSSENPGKPVPSVTTAKNKTTIKPNFKFEFSYNSTTDNNESNDYLQNIVDADPNGYTDICQIEFVIDIDFGGQNNAQQYYGGEFGVGSDGVTHIVEQWGDASGFWSYNDADATPDGAYSKGTLHQWFDVDNIVDTDQMYLVFTYAAKATFNVVLKEVNMFHTEGYDVEQKKVNVGKDLVTNTASAGEVVVPLQSLAGANPFSYFDLDLSYTAAADYTGGVVWVEGVYAEGLTLPNAPRNNVNIGKKMTPGSGTKTEASVRVYLYNYCAIDSTGYIKFICNWAPASKITLNSVTFYTLKGTAGGGGGGQDIVLDDTFLSQTQSPLEELLTMDKIKTAMANSLVNEGNNYLLKQAVARMQAGTNTTIAYIGGSITEGDNMPVDKITDLPGQAYSASWAYWSYKFLAGKYGTGSNVKYHNAGMSGTASDLGVARFQKDVLDFNPSIVFIEFAVNNDDAQLRKESYESMIRMALNDANHPAVVLAMSWTSYSGGAIESYMTQLGVKYGLPVISIHKGLNAYKNLIFQYNSSDPTKCWCSSDNLHPTLNGHKLYAKLIGYGITTIAKKDADSKMDIPSVTYSDKYQTMKLYQRGDSQLTVTGFDTSSSTYVAPTLKSDQVSGQGGWKLNGGTGTISMSANAKAIMVLYCANQYDGSNGKLTVNVTGGYTASANATLPQDISGNPGWGQICVISVLAQDNAQNCQISLSFAGTGQVIGIAVAD